MNPITPWLDPVEVRQLAEQLLRPGGGPAVDAADGGFSEGFEGFAGERPPIPPAEPPPPPAPEPAAVSHGLSNDRILPLRDWLRGEFGAGGMFLLDHEGNLVFADRSDERLHHFARSVALSTRNQGSAPGNVHVKIGAEAILEVIPVETARGWLVLGAVVPGALPPAAVAMVMDALAQVVAPDAPTGPR